MAGERFPLQYEFPFAAASRLVGVDPTTSFLAIDDQALVARFGPWKVVTPLANVDSVSLTGPYAWPKVIGPPRLSFADRGLTFAGNARSGVCVHFIEPVRGIDPFGLVRHPSLTVTVRDPERAVGAIRGRLLIDVASDIEETIDEIEEEAHDELENLTASELREIARADGVRGVSKMKKVDLIEQIERRESRVV